MADCYLHFYGGRSVFRRFARRFNNYHFPENKRGISTKFLAASANADVVELYLRVERHMEQYAEQHHYLFDYYVRRGSSQFVCGIRFRPSQISGARIFVYADRRAADRSRRAYSYAYLSYGHQSASR